jgi:two-component system, LytTR family, response regulator
MIKAIVIEDELEGMEHLLRLIKNNLPEVEVIGTGRSNADLLRMIEDEGLEPHVLVLDIKLPDGQVFQSLEVLDTSKMQLIFTTAYNEYALRAFDKAAIHYILKPISKDALMVAFMRVKNSMPKPEDSSVQLNIARQLMEMGPNALDKVGIGSVDGIRFVAYKSVVRLEGDDNYTTFVMDDTERIITSRNLGYYTDHFAKHHFVKTHQSHMVNFNHMRRYVRGDGGQIEMNNGDIVPLSRRHRAKFLESVRGAGDFAD